jgi:hypothetical protein
MAFRFMLSDSRPWIEAAERARVQEGVPPLEIAHPGNADRAQAQLRGDWGRWSRWGLGVLGVALTTVAALAPAAAVWSSLSMGAVFLPGVLLLLAAGAAFAVPGSWLLIALHRSGRRLVRALAFWTALPYRRGNRERGGSGWLRARTVNFEPDVLVRILSASVTTLGAIFGAALTFFTIAVRPDPAMAVLYAQWTILSLLVTAGLFGGVIRVVNGFGEADPLWNRIRGRMSGPHGG